MSHRDTRKEAAPVRKKKEEHIMISFFTVLGFVFWGIGLTSWFKSIRDDDSARHYGSVVTMAAASWVILLVRLVNAFVLHNGHSPILLVILGIIVIAYTLHTAYFTAWFVFDK